VVAGRREGEGVMEDESPLLSHTRMGKDHSTWGGGH
jgi:hypothetical protein